MSILLAGALIGGGIVLGRLIARSVLGERTAPAGGDPDADVASDTDDDEARARAKEPPVAAKKIDPPKPDRFATLPFNLGDVVLRAGGEEAWLAGALVFLEDTVVAALFVAPEAKNDRAVFARARGGARIGWLDPLPAGAIVTGAEPPSAIEHDGARFDRLRRLPVRVERVGTGAPDVGDRAIVAEYATEAGDALVLVIGAGGTRAFRGVSLDEGMYDVLPGERTRE